MEAPSHEGGQWRLPLRFVGSGSEYFRIWIANLLLTLLTVGLYYPFAKVRRQRYFHGATEVGGFPLSYHADPWSVLRGHGVVAAMFLAYGAATLLSPVAALLVLVGFGLAWPALWHSSLRFRLANTGWRGLRLQFHGTRQGAYRAFAPGIMLAVLVVAAGTLVQAEGPVAAKRADPGPNAAVAGLLPLVMGLAFPALLWRLRRYQHAHYGLAGEQTRFGVPMSAFYGVTFRAGFIATAVGLAAAVGAYSVMVGFGALEGGKGGTGRLMLMALVLVGVVVLAYQGVVGPYMTARLQNLVWNGTRSDHLRFESDLGFGALLGLSLRNWLLVLCTLGLYLPFAAVAMARMRLQAVTVWSTLPPDTLVSTDPLGRTTALGDAAGDVAGIDLGL